MRPITFRATKTTIPNWESDLHTKKPLCYAYRNSGYNIAVYSDDRGLYTIHSGLTASEKTNTSLENWAVAVFGAEEIQELSNEVGSVFNMVWRPGLYYEQEINTSFSIYGHEKILAEQALYILLQKLNEILLYIEPDKNGLLSYGHKTRELLILACTEVENIWKQYMDLLPNTKDRYSTEDYVKLCKPLHLKEFEIAVKPYPEIGIIKPFDGWDLEKASQSLTWYDAYNKTKHARSAYFSSASLKNCIYAVGACIVMFCVKYSPFSLYQSQALLSSHFTQLFGVGLSAPDYKTFYVPKLNVENRVTHLVLGSAQNTMDPWITKPFQL